MSAPRATTAAPTLADWQARLQAHVLHGAPAPQVRAAHAADAGYRFSVYADAYQLRLVEVLGNDYPTLKQQLGATAFAAMCRDYLAAHPSDRPSVRDVGRHLPAWLRRVRGEPCLAELAGFEWTQGAVFDAADDDAALLADLAGLAPQDWPALPLRLRHATRIVSLHSNAPALLLAQTQNETLPSLEASTQPRDWLVWRLGHVVHWRALEDDEALAFATLVSGTTFGAFCETLATLLPHDDVALRAASLLKRWLGDELLRPFVVSQS